MNHARLVLAFDSSGDVRWRAFVESDDYLDADEWVKLAFPDDWSAFNGFEVWSVWRSSPEGHVRVDREPRLQEERD